MSLYATYLSGKIEKILDLKSVSGLKGKVIKPLNILEY